MYSEGWKGEGRERGEGRGEGGGEGRTGGGDEGRGEMGGEGRGGEKREEGRDGRGIMYLCDVRTYITQVHYMTLSRRDLIAGHNITGANTGHHSKQPQCMTHTCKYNA